MCICTRRYAVSAPLAPLVSREGYFTNNMISFGKYEGQTFEWLFFNDPSYVEWMYNKRIHRQERHFDEEQGDEFAELFRRARQLRIPCRLCRERQATRMGMSFHEISAASNSIGFYCDECEHVGNGPDYLLFAVVLL